MLLNLLLKSKGRVRIMKRWSIVLDICLLLRVMVGGKLLGACSLFPLTLFQAWARREADNGSLTSRTLAAGSGNLIPEMLKRGMPDESVKVNELEPHHWAIVADVFDEWPFRPTVRLVSSFSYWSCVLMRRYCSQMLFDEGQFTSLD